MGGILIDAFVHACLVALIVSLIPLSAAACVGVCCSTIQAITQIQEQSIPFVLKLLAASSALYLSRGYWVQELVSCFSDCLSVVSEL